MIYGCIPDFEIGGELDAKGFFIWLIDDVRIYDRVVEP
jgi:hypothetical protein